MAKNEGVMTHAVEKFDRIDFSHWKMNMEDYLYGKKLNKSLAAKPEKMDEEEWKELDKQVLGLIRSCLSRNVVANVAKETTTMGLMNVLTNLYEKPSANNKVLK